MLEYDIELTVNLGRDVYYFACPVAHVDGRRHSGRAEVFHQRRVTNIFVPSVHVDDLLVELIKKCVRDIVNMFMT